MPKYSAASAYSVCVLWLVLAVASGSRSAWTRGLRCGDAADGSDSVTLHVALRVAPARLAETRAAFDAVSDPTSSIFRHFLTRDELTAMLGVPETTAERVARFFLEESSVVTVSPHRDALRVTLDCRRAERIFRVRLFRFTHTRSGVAVLRADVSDSTKLAAQPGHALPPDIAPLVRDVQGIHDFPMQRARLYAGGGNRPRRQTSKSDTAWNDCNGSCSGNLVPSVIQAQYSLPNHTATSLSESKSTMTASSGMAVAEFASNWCQDGLDAIKTACGLSANLTVDRMIGSNGPGGVSY